MLLCVECRHLSPVLSGYRVSGERPRQCESCGELGLIDPTETNAVALLQTMDDDNRLARRSPAARTLARVQSVVGLSIASVVLVGMLVAMFFGRGSWTEVTEFLTMITAVVIVIPMGLLAIRATARHWARTAALPRPGRWALALPAAGTLSVETMGTLDCPEPLTAPLSGRSCAAYEVGVRYDASTTGALGTWLLLEQASARLVVGGVTFSGDNVFLEWPRSVYTGAVEEPRVVEFLRDRGLTATREPLCLFETVIPCDTPVAMCRSSNGVMVLRPSP